MNLGKRDWFGGLLCAASLLAACGGATAPDIEQDSDAVRKLRAIDDHRAAKSSTDPCLELRCYGDGVCDTFCARQDSDCAPSKDQPMVCAAFVETSDGACTRAKDDPCRMQDPDCTSTGAGVPGNPGPRQWSDAGAGVPGNPGPRQWSDAGAGVPGNPGPRERPDAGQGSGGVHCAQYIQQPDGQCSLPNDSPCRFQDPDCERICLAILIPKDGVCPPNGWCDPDCAIPPAPPANDGGVVPPTPPAADAGGVICTAIYTPKDGVCPPNDPCDPDCACPFVANGVCQPTAQAACKAAGCAPDRCIIRESYPAQVACQ